MTQAAWTLPLETKATFLKGVYTRADLRFPQLFSPQKFAINNGGVHIRTSTDLHIVKSINGSLDYIQ